MATAKVVAPYKATATPMGGFSETRLRREHAREIPPRLLHSHYIYDALVCLTACYPKKFGPRGIGHAGVMWIGLQCDIEDEGYAPSPHSTLQLCYSTFASPYNNILCAWFACTARRSLGGQRRAAALTAGQSWSDSCERRWEPQCQRRCERFFSFDSDR